MDLGEAFFTCVCVRREIGKRYPARPILTFLIEVYQELNIGGLNRGVTEYEPVGAITEPIL